MSGYIFRKEDIISHSHRSPSMDRGIYFLIDNEEIVYIGVSEQMMYRVITHAREKKKHFDSFSMLKMDCSQEELYEYETENMIYHNCKYNKVISSAKYMSINCIKIKIKSIFDVYSVHKKTIKKNLNHLNIKIHMLNATELVHIDDVEILIQYMKTKGE